MLNIPDNCTAQQAEVSPNLMSGSDTSSGSGFAAFLEQEMGSSVDDVATVVPSKNAESGSSDAPLGVTSSAVNEQMTDLSSLLMDILNDENALQSSASQLQVNMQMQPVIPTSDQTNDLDPLPAPKSETGPDTTAALLVTPAVIVLSNDNGTAETINIGAEGDDNLNERTAPMTAGPVQISNAAKKNGTGEITGPTQGSDSIEAGKDGDRAEQIKNALSLSGEGVEDSDISSDMTKKSQVMTGDPAKRLSDINMPKMDDTEGELFTSSDMTKKGQVMTGDPAKRLSDINIPKKDDTGGEHFTYSHRTARNIDRDNAVTVGTSSRELSTAGGEGRTPSAEEVLQKISAGADLQKEVADNRGPKQVPQTPGMKEIIPGTSNIQNSHNLNRTDSVIRDNSALFSPRTGGLTQSLNDIVYVIRGGNHVGVSVDHETFGRLDISVRMEKGQMNVQVNACERSARDFIENNAQYIIDSLAREGLNVSGFSVSLKERGNDQRQDIPVSGRTVESDNTDQVEQIASDRVISVFA